MLCPNPLRINRLHLRHLPPDDASSYLTTTYNYFDKMEF